MKFSICLIAISAFAAVSNALPCEHECEHTVDPCESELPPLSNPGTGGNECEHGEYSCQGSDTAVCNWGIWSITECLHGTRCVPGDWECVPESDWQRVFEQTNPPQTEEVLSAPLPTLEVEPAPMAPEGSCTTGEFACFGRHTLQCDHSKWIIHICPPSTSCVDNDFECIPVENGEWDRVYEQVNPGMTSPGAPSE